MIRATLFMLSALLLGLGGCGQPEPAPGAADRALQDPMNYSPKAERVDVSGGGIMDLDRKAIKQDMSNVLNP